MTKWRRRSVLATGATLTAGGALASIGAGDVSEVDELPDPDIDPNPGMDEQWASFDGDAGHAKFVDDAATLDGDALEAAWSVDFDLGRNLAVAIADGSIRWQTEFEPEDRIVSQTVAYGSVFIVADGALYALETDDGSIRWEIDTITAEPPYGDGDEEEYDVLDTTAAANGVVYAGAGEREGGATVALDPETGEEVWRGNSNYYTGRAQARATSTAVTVSRVDYYAQCSSTPRPARRSRRYPRRAFP
jgi:outer membrane protein assembly factor BamB